MWKLTIEDDEGKQTGLPLAHDEYGLGRAEENSIRLTDRNVSRRHATLTKNGQGWQIKDLDSYNGTFVNGVRVAGEQHLRHGDLVQLGDYRLELLDESLLPQSASPQPAQGRGTTLSPLHTRPNRLVMVVGPTPGAEFALDGERFTIGRSEDASISINHSSVSRIHAELISLGNGRYEIVDKQSANGIRINGVELKRGLLEAGDALELGDVRLRFVGAGKIFRADATQQAPAVVGGFESVAPSSLRAQALPLAGRASGAGKLVLILAVIGVIAGIGIFAVSRYGGGAPGKDVGVTPATAAPPDADARVLQAAREKLDAQDMEGAHAAIQAIPETSPARDDQIFKEVEARWADAMFLKVEQTESNADKRALLNKIASTPTVDADRRTKAGDMIANLNLKEQPSPQPQPQPQPLHSDPYPGTQPQGPSTVASQPGAQPGASTAPTAKPSSTAAASVPTGAIDASQYDATRRALEGKVWSGKASVEEIKMLRAICSHQGDRACRDKANAMLQQKQNAP